MNYDNPIILDTIYNFEPEFDWMHEIIERNAYFKWLDVGKPEGRDLEFWTQAENEYNKIKNSWTKECSQIL